MKALGIDFGGYTEWERSAIKGKQVDFVICGIAWGTSLNPTWEHNKPQIKDEKRRLLYTFFNHAPPWKEQADLILEEAEAVDAHSIWLDLERSRYGLREDLNMRSQAQNAWMILNRLQDNFDGRMGGYSNFNDYWLIQQHFNFNSFDWWIAYPDEYGGNEPGTQYWWDKINRPYGDYIFDQWSWKGYAPDYGAVNNKKSMDLTQCKYDLDWLDEWLGIDSPPVPQPDCSEVRNQTLDEGIEALEGLRI